MTDISITYQDNSFVLNPLVAAPVSAIAASVEAIVQPLVDEAEAAALVSGPATPAIRSTERYGKPTTPVTGTDLGARTIVPGDAKPTKGKWQFKELGIYLMADDPIILRRFDATTGVQKGSDITINGVAGLNTFTAGDLPSTFNGDANEYLGFYTTDVAYQVSGAPGRGCIAQSGNVTTITLSPETSFRGFLIEAYFEVEEVYTSSAVETAKSRLTGGTPIDLPADFHRIKEIFDVGVKPDGYAAHTYNPQDVCPITSPSDAGSLTYVDPVSGDDSTGDGSSGNPYKSLNKALDGVTGTVWVRFNGNLDNATNGVGASLVADAIVIEGIDGADTISERFGSLSWSLVGGTTATYTASCPAAIGAVFDEGDPDANDGFASALTLDGGYSSGELTAGEYAVSGTTVYVRTANDDDLSSDDTNLKVMGAGRHFDVDEETAITIWMDGVNIEGGEAMWMDVSAGIAIPFVYINNANLLYGSGTDDFIRNYTQFGLLGLYNCNIVETYSDAAGYQNGFGFEIDCNFYRCGEREAGGASNASTGHGSSTQLRISTRSDRGIYQAYGKPIHDVGGGNSYQIGIKAGPSTSTGAEDDRTAYTYSNTVTAYLVNCRVDENAHRSLNVDGTGDVSVYNLKTNGVALNSTSGAITPYWPF